ncbi:MAG: L,D-transpeptidase [Dehalococcoidia bacterium]
MNVRVLLIVLVLAGLLAGCRAKPAPEPAVVVAAVATATPAPVVATPVATATATAVARLAATVPPRTCPPASGRWIDVNVSTLRVRLMEGAQVVQEVGPVAVGREVDTGNYESTQTGCFGVYTKNAEMTYDAPYKTYISHWVGFDPAKDNGFHSFLLDAKGNVVDASTGRVSNGCIRTGQADAIYRFAEVGMTVWVHA